MKVARFVLKIVALSLTTAAVVCAVIAYWDKVAEFCRSSFALGRGRMACTPHGGIAPALAEQGAVGSWRARNARPYEVTEGAI